LSYLQIGVEFNHLPEHESCQHSYFCQPLETMPFSG